MHERDRGDESRAHQIRADHQSSAIESVGEHSRERTEEQPRHDLEQQHAADRELRSLRELLGDQRHGENADPVAQ